MKTIGAVAAAAVALMGLNAWAGTTDPLQEVKPSNAVETAKPVLARVTATEIDGNDLAVDELLKIATSEEESLRLAAVEVLGEMASTRARAVLGVILYSNRLATVRAAAADQLGNMGDGESVFALALALEMEHDAEVRDVIAANLERNLPIDGASVASDESESDGRRNADQARIEPEPTATPGRPEVAMADAG